MQLYKRGIQRDVHRLGAILGEILAEQTSKEDFETVEAIRTYSLDYRDGSIRTRDPLKRTLSELSDDQRLTVARAFTTFFELINLAEERERVRALREQTQAGVPDNGLEEAIETLAQGEPETAQRVLNDILIQPTFTAHPTEARRKTVMAQLRSVASVLETLDERLLTDKETRQLTETLHAEITSLWQTPQLRERRPEPTDEALNVQWYLDNVLFDVTAEVYSELTEETDEAFDDIAVPKLFEFRSWAGSDRDGNPYVTPDVTETILERQRRVVIDHYRTAIEDLTTNLSQHERRVEVGQPLSESLSTDSADLPKIADRVSEQYSNEPYRRKLLFIRERLDRVKGPKPGGYTDADEFRSDLELIANDLRANGATQVAETHVDPLLRQVSTFGFSLASLDLRDHRQQHTQAIEELLGYQQVPYADMTEGERVEFLTEAILSDTETVELRDREELSESTERICTRFLALADWQREYGSNAIDTYCISMTEEPSHVLEVLFLADAAGVADLPEYCGVDIVPLLETEYALSDADRIMGTLFENEAYTAALAARGNTQEIMLGYSDSNKENGFLAARWSLYRNQRRLSEITDAYGIDLRLFHGRGGSISRGGGPMHEGLLALPNETVTGDVKFTEQGEVIAEKYANPHIAERELEQMLNAQIRARYEAIKQPTEPVPDEWIQAMDTAAKAAREAYRDLLTTDGFVSYFEQATPISVIEDLNIGSRPASRSGDRSVEDLRAIPWVFSWTQSRCIMPGWFSLASGLNAYLDGGGSIKTLRRMYDEWPFFQTMIDNAALAVARTDLEIAEEYAMLADEELRQKIFSEIEDEYVQVRKLILEITQRETVVKSGWLNESLERRNPYVDPLNLLQVQLLSTSDRSAVSERALRLTVKGIAAGMKSTG